MKHKLLYLFFILVMLLVVSCSSYGTSGHKPLPLPGPGDCNHSLTVTTDLSDEQRIIFNNDVARWNAIATEQFCTQPGEVNAATDQHIVFTFEHGGEYWKTLSQQFGGADVLGIYFGMADAIGFAMPQEDETFELTGLHELGHAHGLDHTVCPAIMCPYVGSATDFTPNDETECRRVGACATPDAGAVVAPKVLKFDTVYVFVR